MSHVTWGATRWMLSTQFVSEDFQIYKELSIHALNKWTCGVDLNENVYMVRFSWKMVFQVWQIKIPRFMEFFKREMNVSHIASFYYTIHIENICIQFSKVGTTKSILKSVIKYIHLCVNGFNHCQFMEL